jgi:hypothetical protein
MEVKLNIFSATQHPPSENECFFLYILKEFVEDPLPGILTKDHFSLPFIDQTLLHSILVFFFLFLFIYFSFVMLLTLFMLYFMMPIFITMLK